MSKIKIVTIGGGSSYTPELIEGFIKRKAELPIKEIWLVDIEDGKEKLEIVGNLAKRMVKEAGLDWDVHLTLDREEALKDKFYSLAIDTVDEAYKLCEKWLCQEH